MSDDEVYTNYDQDREKGRTSWPQPAAVPIKKKQVSRSTCAVFQDNIC